MDATRATADLSGGVDPAAAKAVRPTRTLRTQVYFPAHEGQASGPFPLVIFAHGNTVSDPAATYSALLKSWAAAGYVVAAPTFPLSSTRAASGLADLVN